MGILIPREGEIALTPYVPAAFVARAFPAPSCPWIRRDGGSVELLCLQEGELVNTRVAAIFEVPASGDVVILKAGGFGEADLAFLRTFNMVPSSQSSQEVPPTQDVPELSQFSASPSQDKDDVKEDSKTDEVAKSQDSVCIPDTQEYSTSQEGIAGSLPLASQDDIPASQFV